MIKFILFFALFSSNLFAKEYIDVVVESTSTKKSKNAAKQEMLSSASESVAVKYIKELISEDKYNQNLQLINASILKNKGRFIPYVKSNEFEKADDGFVMNVAIKISVDDLKQVLLKHGLLYKLKGQPRIVPFVKVMDQVNSVNLSWWSLNKTNNDYFLSEVLKQLNSKLYLEFMQHNFYQVQPLLESTAHLVPVAFHEENLRKEDKRTLSEFLMAQIMITGDVIIKAKKSISDAYEISVKLKAVQTGNGRIIGEISRSYDTEIGSFKSVVQKKFIIASELVAKDLSVQVLGAWQKGTFGANLLKLTLNGRWGFKELSELKKGLKKLKSVKGLRERLYSPESVTFEIDAEVGARSFAKELDLKVINGFKFKVAEVGEDKVVVDSLSASFER